MRNEIVVKSTTNRGEFNRAYKLHLEQRGKIRCSICGYNRGENDKSKWYGGFVYDDMVKCYGRKRETHTRYPNWKLVSKNPKQWMKKPLRVVTDRHRFDDRAYITIKF